MQRSAVVEGAAGHACSVAGNRARRVGTAGEVHPRALVLAAAVMMSCAALLTGCSYHVSLGGGTPIVAKEDLQNDIAKKIEEAGGTAQSVSCRDDLEGVVGKTVRCEVVLSATDAVDAILKVTNVEGTTVNYELTVVLSQAQLEKTVGDLVTEKSSTTVESVTCESGLEGKKGNEAHCTVVGDGVAIPSTVKVTKVDGLDVSISVIPD